MRPLSETLKGKSNTLVWSESMTEAFQATKVALAKATLLMHPLPDVQTSITTDASESAIGAVLQQQVDGKEGTPGFL